ncbi:MAG: hypothetical protein O7E57_01405, partial [Gammaproteobacteria bacterium]|nr:hypothetical protein [Gammaproteobacteria bacterium]
RYLFNARDIESPAYLQGERFWFVVYGLAAFAYRILIMYIIILYIGGKFFALGIVLAMWAGFTMIGMPLAKHTRYLFTGQQLRKNRGRAVGVSFLVVLAVLSILFVLPAPYWTRTEGIIWPTEQSQIRAATEGFVVEVKVPSGTWVERGEALIATRDPMLEARLKMLLAEKKQVENQLVAAQTTNLVQAAILREAMAAVDAAVELANQRMGDLLIRSPREGMLVVPTEQDLPDRFLQKGQLIGYVINPDDPVNVRVVVKQDDIGLVREGTRTVHVIPAEWGGESFVATIKREIPGGTNQLPSAALGLAGGGMVPVDPRDNSGRITLERIFELEVVMPDTFQTQYLGRRVYVRLDHGDSPLGMQLFRALRQLFLRQFNV